MEIVKKIVGVLRKTAYVFKVINALHKALTVFLDEMDIINGVNSNKNETI